MKLSQAQLLKPGYKVRDISTNKIFVVSETPKLQVFPYETICKIKCKDGEKEVTKDYSDLDYVPGYEKSLLRMQRS